MRVRWEGNITTKEIISIFPLWTFQQKKQNKINENKTKKTDMKKKERKNKRQNEIKK
jgi:hypothetical protein